MKKQAAIASFALLMVPVLSHAQGLGSIVGTVTDPSGGAIASAQVTATEVGTGFAREARTDDQGYFVIPSLPRGVPRERRGERVQRRQARGYAIGRSDPHREHTAEAGHVHGDCYGQRREFTSGYHDSDHRPGRRTTAHGGIAPKRP